MQKSPTLGTQLRREFFEDGLGEGLLGGFALVAAALIFLQPPGQGGVWPWMVLMLVPGILFGPVLRALKKRVSAPRSGSVRHTRAAPPLALLTLPALLAVAAVAAVAGLATRGWALQSSLAPLPAILGACFAAALATCGLRYGIRRFLVLAAIFALCGATAALLSNARPLSSSLLLLLLMGATLEVSSALVLIRFRRHHQVPPELRP